MKPYEKYYYHLSGYNIPMIEITYVKYMSIFYISNEIKIEEKMETKHVQELSDMFKGKTLLITGGTGSFGNAMIKGFLDSQLEEIRIFSRDEKKQEDMRIKYKNEKLNFILGDVRNFNDINQAMMGVDFVFHAAALKQVPSCEFYPMQAVQTNI